MSRSTSPVTILFSDLSLFQTKRRLNNDRVLPEWRHMAEELYTDVWNLNTRHSTVPENRQRCMCHVSDTVNRSWSQYTPGESADLKMNANCNLAGWGQKPMLVGFFVEHESGISLMCKHANICRLAKDTEYCWSWWEWRNFLIKQSTWIKIWPDTKCINLEGELKVCEQFQALETFHYKQRMYTSWLCN